MSNYPTLDQVSSAFVQFGNLSNCVCSRGALLSEQMQEQVVQSPTLIGLESELIRSKWGLLYSSISAKKQMQDVLCKKN